MSHPPADDVSIAERSGHIPGRPVSWVVVVLVCAGFLAAGIGLILARPWLFIVGVAVVLLGVVLGWATHAMADVTARVEKGVPRAAAAESIERSDQPAHH